MMNQKKNTVKQTIIKAIAVCFIAATVIGTAVPVITKAAEVNVEQQAVVNKKRINPKTGAPMLNIDESFKEHLIGFKGKEVQRKDLKRGKFYILQNAHCHPKSVAPPMHTLEVVKVVNIEHNSFLWMEYDNVKYYAYNSKGSRKTKSLLNSAGNVSTPDRFFEITDDMFERW